MNHGPVIPFRMVALLLLAALSSGCQSNPSEEESESIRASIFSGDPDVGYLTLENAEELAKFRSRVAAGQEGWVPTLVAPQPELILMGADFRYDFHKEEEIVLRVEMKEGQPEFRMLWTDLSGFTFADPASYRVVESHVGGHPEGI